MSWVLVDTSVWVEHFRGGSVGLEDLLEADRVIIHPMVLGEVACGTPPARAQTLRSLSNLHPSQQATLKEVLAFVEQERLYGMGCGLNDLSLLASVMLMPGCTLWTLDKRLYAMAERFGVAYAPSFH